MPRIRRHAACLTLLAAAVCAHSQTPSDAAPAQTSIAVAALPSSTSSVSTRKQRQAEDAYLAGARELDQDHPADAIADFTRAAQLNPDNPDYPRALLIAREHRITQLVQQSGRERILGHDIQADALLAQARPLDPTNPILLQHDNAAPQQVSPNITSTSQLFPPAETPPAEPAWLPPIPHLAGAIQLQPSPARHSFHTHADSQEVLRSITQAYGIRANMDSSVASQDIRFDLDDASYADAMRIALLMTHTIAVPLDPTSVILARDTPENRQSLETQLTETLALPGLSTTEITEVNTLIKTVFDVKQSSVEPGLGTIVVRAPEETIKVINATLGDMIDGGSDVLLDIRIYSVDTSRTTNLGAQLPQSFGAYNVPAVAESAISANQSAINQAVSSGLLVLNGDPIQNLVKEALFLAAAGLINSSQIGNTIGFFGGGITTTGLSLGATPIANFALNTSDSRALEDIQTRIGNNQDAVLKIGTRYPIPTAIYSSAVPQLPSSIAGATVNGVSVSSLLSQFSGAATSIPQFQFEDLGLTLKATPHIQKSGDITVHLDLKIEALAGGTINSIPILASRTLTSQITVADSVTAIIAGNVTSSEMKAVSGIPGLSELPGFQSTSNDDVQKTAGHLIILLTPHIVRQRNSILTGPRIAVTNHGSTD